MRLAFIALLITVPCFGKDAPIRPVTPPPKQARIASPHPISARPARPLLTWSQPHLPPARPPSLPPHVPAARPAAQYSALGLQPTTFTPYDRFLDTVWPVLRHLDSGEVSMLRVLRLMDTGHSFTYRLTDPYRATSPDLTAARKSGDCKSKALWLCSALGDPNALWVIGKKTRTADENHAWVYWRSEGRWYILDCTETTRPLAAATIPPDRYIPYYSFGKTGAFRHMATRIQLVTAPPQPQKSFARR